MIADGELVVRPDYEDALKEAGGTEAQAHGRTGKAAK